MRKIKVLEFSNQRGLGGTDKESESLMKFYDRNKFEIFSASWRGGERLKWIEDNNILNLTTENQEEMIKWIKDKNIDVVNFYRAGGPENILIDTFKKAGIPILIERNVFALFDNTYDRSLIDKHIFYSQASKDIYKQRSSYFYEESKVRVIGIGTDGEKYNEFDFNRNWEEPIFGRYSRKDMNKWHPINIQCLPLIKEQVPNAKFYVIGLPDDYRKYAQEIGVIDMIVEFPLTVNEQETMKFLKDITVFSHGSICGESFGLVLAESMFSGLPIVTHTGGDSAQCELVTDGFNGYYVSPNDVKGYADKIIYLLKNPSEKIEMGQKGKERAIEKYDIRKTTKMFEELYIEEFKRKNLL